MKNKIKLLTLFILISGSTLLSGCFVTATLQKEPPMIVRKGNAPKLAFVVYSKNDDVGVTIFDVQLNIDPTSEDSWTWSTAPSNTKTFYL